MRKYLLSLAIIVIAAVVAFLTVTSSPRRASGATTPISHVVLILEENHNAPTAKNGMPFLRSQGNTFAQTSTTTYSAITHPSLPNYLALTEGTTGGVGGDCGTTTATCMQSGDNIFHQAAGNWAGWAESMKGNCENHNSNPYVVHHAPAPFYSDLLAGGDGTCASKDVPFSSSTPPRITAGFTFLTPNLNHDAHNGSLSSADSWLKTVVTKLKADPNYQNGSTLIEVTFDEGSSGNNHVYTVFINPALSQKTISTKANHYSLLRLNEDLLGLPRLGGAQTAADLRPALGL